MDNNIDNILFVKICNGNSDAFDSLFRKYYSVLCRFSLIYLKNSSDAEEVVQAMFVKLWESKKKIKITGSVKSYLFSSVKNTTLNFLKKGKVKREHEINFGLENKVNDTEKESLNKIKFKHIYNKGVEELPDKCRYFYLLSRNEGLTYGEIAETENVSKKTVENQMGIALKRLREYMLPYLPEIKGYS